MESLAWDRAINTHGIIFCFFVNFAMLMFIVYNNYISYTTLLASFSYFTYLFVEFSSQSLSSEDVAQKVWGKTSTFDGRNDLLAFSYYTQ